ncbi:NAD(P)H-dependent oxidoreductase [Rhodohalobacter sp. SW132]|uniref:NADPH-dependent FMN reductase n=1 Tax=Rhodohalobacter sp. SW132 TaxID=2293433 RepID=UPI000E24FEC2|nr:NADPH-dependent FMN reductase [Rhodohalobacter sp. SW132]REL37806.1 NAD(P)H-dependent oxidoreductase [Rhodohalobacter sp. SW132]
MKIIAFAGSLRSGSFNKSLLKAAIEEASDSLEIEIFDLDGIPLFNADIETEGDPKRVSEFKDAIRSADGILIASPEYNHGMTGVTKNAIDWASRPGNDMPIGGKPVGILGASPGITGTARSQDQLRQSLKSVGAHCMPKPELLLFRAHEKFDNQGNLTDDSTRRFLGKYLKAFEEWIKPFT